MIPINPKYIPRFVTVLIAKILMRLMILRSEDYILYNELNHWLGRKGKILVHDSVECINCGHLFCSIHPRGSNKCECPRCHEMLDLVFTCDN